MEQIRKVTVMESTHVTKECNVTAGTPPLTVLWENVKSGQIIEEKLLNISNITRYQREYRCIANNSCGGNSTTMVIDVQCKNVFITCFSSLLIYSLSPVFSHDLMFTHL